MDCFECIKISLQLKTLKTLLIVAQPTLFMTILMPKLNYSYEEKII